MESRRKFIKQSLTGIAAFSLLPAVNTFAGQEQGSFLKSADAPKLRFALASDGHYGQPGTQSDKMFADLISWLNDEHSKKPLDFVIFNGDLVHDDPKLLEVVKLKYFNDLKMPFYAVPGNHDRCSTSRWKSVFGYEDNYVFESKGTGFVMGNTSNEKGEYICPDNEFLKRSLDSFKDKKVVFVVLHIPPHKWLPQETYFVHCEDTLKLLHQYPNLKAVFHGHDHSLDGIRYTGKLPHLFDGHFGGNWGTDYKGYRIVEIDDENKIFTYQVNAGMNPVINSKRI
ncbi:metallophosphoesterase [Pedobacter sp. P351]|uniref:metallophosphoesterase family protein n=1 Tax=Pedobacter superstes TaxID=3133441 RepID=UPI0030A5230C